MLKKLLAGATAIVLGLGIVALVAAPAQAHNSTVTGSAVCTSPTEATITWTVKDDWTTASTVSSVDLTPTGTLTPALAVGDAFTAEQTKTYTETVSTKTDYTLTVGMHWDASGNSSAYDNSGNATVTINDATFAACVQAPPTPPVDTTPYVLVAWSMPSWSGDYYTPTWNPYQSFFAKTDLATEDLNALDAQLTACGTQYQVDLYNDSTTTSSLIAGGNGKLYGPGNPSEDFPSPAGWGITYKLIHNPGCATATASITTQPTCTAIGVATFSLTNATWETTPPTTVGQHTVNAIATSGFEFSPGVTTLPVTYTIPDKLDPSSPQCVTTIPPPTLNCLTNTDQDGNLVLPAITGVKWVVNGGTPTAGPITVVLGLADAHIQAVPASTAYVFSAGQTTWTFDADTQGCQIPTFADFPTNLTYSDPNCTTGKAASGSVTVGDVDGVEFFTDEVDYFLDGSTTPVTSSTFSVGPGVHTVTAAPHDPDDTLDGSRTWTFTIGAAVICPLSLKTLALTGTSSPAGWIGLGSLLLLSGLGLLTVYTVRRRVDQE